jgi:hypothetical protein
VPLADSNLPPSLFLNTLRESLLSPRAPARKVRRRSQTAHPPLSFFPRRRLAPYAHRVGRGAHSHGLRGLQAHPFAARTSSAYRVSRSPVPCQFLSSTRALVGSRGWVVTALRSAPRSR